MNGNVNRSANLFTDSLKDIEVDVLGRPITEPYFQWSVRFVVWEIKLINKADSVFLEEWTKTPVNCSDKLIERYSKRLI